MTGSDPVPSPGRVPPGARSPRWGLGDAVTGFLLAVVASTLAIGVVVAFDPDAADTGMAAVVVGFVAMWVGLLGWPVVASRTKGAGTLRADFGLEVRRADLAFVLLGAALQFAIVLLYLPFDALGWLDLDEVGEPARDLADRAGSVGVGFALLAVAAVVGAPVIEELFFRGLVLRAAQRRYGPGPAVAVSAVAFGVGHLQPLQFPALVLVGLVCAGLAARAGRLGPAIAVHLGFNAVAMVQLGVDLAN